MIEPALPAFISTNVSESTAGFGNPIKIICPIILSRASFFCEQATKGRMAKKRRRTFHKLNVGNCNCLSPLVEEPVKSISVLTDDWGEVLVVLINVLKY